MSHRALRQHVRNMSGDMLFAYATPNTTCDTSLANQLRVSIEQLRTAIRDELRRRLDRRDARHTLYATYGATFYSTIPRTTRGDDE